MRKEKPWAESRQKRYHERNPWVKFLSRARYRCKGRTSAWKRLYRDKGIICDLTLAQIKELWDRGGASKMQQPSLDRIDSMADYSFSNCRFIEFALNRKLALHSLTEREMRSVGMVP